MKHYANMTPQERYKVLEDVFTINKRGKFLKTQPLEFHWNRIQQYKQENPLLNDIPELDILMSIEYFDWRITVQFKELCYPPICDNNKRCLSNNIRK